MSFQVWIAGTVGCAAIIDDLARRRISNWIPLLAFISGLTLQTAQKGWRGALFSLAGTIAGASVFLVFYLLGGLGGGDIKLVSGFGAVLGPSLVLEAALWAAGCGGLIAVGAIAMSAVRRYWQKQARDVAGAHREMPKTVESIPYAPAIAIGVWLSLASKAAGVAP